MTAYRYDPDCERVLPVSGGDAERLVEDVPPHVSCSDEQCREAVELECAKVYGWKECLECDQWTCPDHLSPVGPDGTDAICDDCKEWM